MFTFNWKVDSIKTLSLQRAQMFRACCLLGCHILAYFEYVILYYLDELFSYVNV